jgi:hypothetical protein
MDQISADSPKLHVKVQTLYKDHLGLNSRPWAISQWSAGDLPCPGHVERAPAVDDLVCQMYSLKQVRGLVSTWIELKLTTFISGAMCTWCLTITPDFQSAKVIAGFCDTTSFDWWLCCVYIAMSWHVRRWLLVRILIILLAFVYSKLEYKTNDEMNQVTSHTL